MNLSLGLNLSDVNGEVLISGALALSKNLYNYATRTQDIYVFNEHGGLFPNTAYDTSDFIPVKAGQSYKPNSNIRYSCYFDIDGDVVQGGISESSSAFFIVPANAVSVRISIQSDNPLFQLEKGTVTTAFEPY